MSKQTRNRLIDSEDKLRLPDVRKAGGMGEKSLGIKKYKLVVME